MATTQIKGSNIEDGTVVAADIKDDSITNTKIKSDAAIATSKISGLAASATTDTTDASNISSGTLPTARLASALDLSGKTVTLPAAAVTAHAVTPTLDSPVITGTLSVLDSDNVTHTVANWSDDLSYTITPTNCTVGAVNASGQFVVTHTSGTPSYTIKATTASLGLADSSLVTKNITMQLSAPTLSSPANGPTATNVVYTITSTSTGDDKLVLDIGSSNFTYQSVSVGTASKVGNTVECIGFTTNNPAVTIQFTAEATYSVTAKAVNIAGTYGTSADSSADSITIANWMVATSTGAVDNSGTVVDTNYKIHTFNTSGTFTFDVTQTGDLPEVEYLVIGGGGSGAWRATAGGDGGGGAGGYRTATGFPVAQQSYTVIVGAGAAGPNSGSTRAGAKGSNSTFSTIISTGGGLGGCDDNTSGGTGGSGGGSNYGSPSASGAGNEGGFSPVEGYRGGYGYNAGPSISGGGGGGASAVGGNHVSGCSGGVGGAGRSSSITGSSVPRGGGGGGSGDNRCSGVGGAGGTGGGGNGCSNTGTATAGAANTGGGGGAIGSGGSGSSSGGSGVVIIKYRFQ